jgi:ATP-dependent DNA helicase DinG
MIKPEQLKKQIEKSFAKLKFVPRGNQESIVYDVLDSFLNKEKTNVVLGAPTGVGKSIIGAVVSDALNAFTPEDPDLSSIISMGTNVLAHQYYDSFSSLENYQVFQIKGASNYSCNYMENQIMPLSKTAEDCLKSKLHPLEVDNYCRGCEYDAAKKLVNITSILITNYSYFLVSIMASGHLKPRKLHVFDEAHLLNDIFCNYTEILVSVDQIDKNIKELSETNGKCDDFIAGLIMLKNQITNSNIGDNNYKQVLEILRKLYFEIVSVLDNQATLLEKVDVIKSSRMSKLSRKYGSLGGKIKDFFDNDYEHVFDNTVPNTFTVKTIFVGKMITKLLAKYNLFMSATITKEFSFSTLNLEVEDTEFIEVDPVFPKENKPIFFLGKQALNYETMKHPDTINDLKAQVKTIVEFHEKDKGLIMVPSFYLGSQIVRSIGHKTRVFEHKSGMNLPVLVSEFKAYVGPAILVSPSIFEGLDFKDDHSRYQIIVKSPYPSLGDKRIKYISSYYPKIYSEMALLKILQGIGRSIRTPTDYAVTYCLDSSTRKLYDSKTNIWKLHYDVKN